MKIRERIEEQEFKILSSYAAKSREAVRDHEEPLCDFRTAFQRDRDRVIHSKAFRRLKHKTQVYISPGDHYRMRMTHSLEVAQISRTIARGLRLNEDLTEAIALGHDVGHTPFGHAGEYALRDLIGRYHHNEQSLRVVEHLERNGQGLNLTAEVRDGILNHTGENKPFTLEGNIVCYGDRIAYLCHDYDDGIRAGMLKPVDLPAKVSKVLGSNPSSMITVMVSDIITESDGKNEIIMSGRVKDAMNEFRSFMFSRIYRSDALEPDRKKAMYVISKLFESYMSAPGNLPQEFLEREERWGLQTIVVDYIAGLTDLYAIKQFEKLFIPATWGIPK
ncbi:MULTISPECIES: deoxyguanosinetriphosphate triphosphohydrolase [Sporomusa]|jgi:dGTPase|uniref:Deoxyguanosinetriphosphate triphosphohydrolase n=2 Tax=Sporomusa TaxID=2375 RepID=A0ABM9VX89_9FIRM|nr:deoxyguanosinetriphosphate triphosphohydrolase [Sporomusa sphaeroides]OLS58391.1 deoxyguanosinetriphosphate triphosphohydrolase [Sporomusa sphaeroides DSM 2875]CVK17422.1 Deoxyguanosinetriphosphate triphosphohydrolase [Sporomusa sphaeroides DSM 2875]SCM80249.1 Deoxyguanosinetriphosphate triphosphohydrolase-like protein [uncultured Sporomusa sp.]HML31698.1 deoxyguanosinetriphosphate triphosphohydrolase [Sporomusa sphaeroides]